MNIDFANVVKRVFKRSGDGAAYIVGDDYESAANLFDAYNVQKGLCFKRRDDAAHKCVVFEINQEAVIFIAELSVDERNAIAADFDFVIDLEDK